MFGLGVGLRGETVMRVGEGRERQGDFFQRYLDGEGDAHGSDLSSPEGGLTQEL